MKPLCARCRRNVRVLELLGSMSHHQPIAVVLDFVNPERAGQRAFVCRGAEVVGFKGEHHKPSYRSVIPYVQLSR